MTPSLRSAIASQPAAIEMSANWPVEDLTMTERFHGTLQVTYQVIGIAPFEKPSAAGTAEGSAGFLLTISEGEIRCL
jgi:hypothetical protein